MKITKNSKVILTQQVKLDGRDLRVGTELFVWKVKRDGTLYCSCAETHGSTVCLKPNEVILARRNCVMPRVGDLFYSSWGYDQTNIDFYQITAVKGKMIEARQIAGQSKYDGPMHGHTKPNPGCFIGDSKRYLVRFNSNDRPYFKVASYASAWPCQSDSSHFFSEWA
jgi:hypothetical protein